jgi:hypothetical protein
MTLVINKGVGLYTCPQCGRSYIVGTNPCKIITSVKFTIGGKEYPPIDIRHIPSPKCICGYDLKQGLTEVKDGTAAEG